MASSSQEGAVIGNLVQVVEAMVKGTGDGHSVADRGSSRRRRGEAFPSDLEV